jgi:integrase
MTSPMPLSVNVVQIRKPRTRQVRTKKAHMDNAQLENFLRAARDYGKREHAMFLFAFAHGARASEVSNLRISDVNFRTEQVAIARLKGSLDTTQALLRVKGNALFDERAALKAWLAVRKADASDFVFNSQKSCRLNRVTVFKLFRKIATAAGLPEALRHPHVAKHTCAMSMVNAGAGAFHIKQHLGHKSFDSTLEYIDVGDVDASKAFAKAMSMAF